MAAPSPTRTPEKKDGDDGEAKQVDLAYRPDGNQETDPERVIDEADRESPPTKGHSIEQEQSKDGGHRHRVDDHDAEEALSERRIHARHVDDETEEGAHPEDQLEQVRLEVVRAGARLAGKRAAAHSLMNL